MNEELLPASRGAGPLLQRDYWAMFGECELRPSELIARMKSRFCELPPASLVTFTAPDGLAAGARLDISIRPAQRCAVRVVHQDAQSITLATLDGHPEAGRITFASYRNGHGALLFHIRSRARSTSALKRIGFLAIGDAMQTNTWVEFIRNTASLVGARIAGVIHAQTEQVDEVADDDEPLSMPTFLAVGD